MQTPIEFGKNFLIELYTKRDIPECMASLADDVIWIMPETAVHLRGQKEAFAFLKQRLDADPERYYVDVSDILSDPASDTIRTVSYQTALVPVDPSKTKRVRISLVIRTLKKDTEIAFVHISPQLSPSDPGPIREFMNLIPAEIMMVQGSGNGSVRLLWQNDGFLSALGYSAKEFRANTARDPFFMLSVRSRERLSGAFSDPDTGMPAPDTAQDEKTGGGGQAGEDGQNAAAGADVPAEKEAPAGSADAAAAPQPVLLHTRARCKDGTVRDYELAGRYAFTDDNGKVSCLLFYDSTELRAKTVQLEESEAVFRKLPEKIRSAAAVFRLVPPTPAEGTDVPAATGSYTGSLLYCSGGVLQLFGLTEEEYAAAAASDLLTGFDLTNVRKDSLLRDHVYRAGEDTDPDCGTYTLKRPDGLERQVLLHLSGAAQQDGAFVCWLGYTDMTDRREELEALRDNCRIRIREEELARKEAEKQLATAEERAKDAADEQIRTIRRETDEKIAAVQEECSARASEIQKQADSRIEEAERKAEERAAGAEKEAERKADEADHNRMAFLTRVDGNMRSPSESVLALTDQLESEGRLSEKQQDALAKIREASRYMLDSVDRLLQVSGTVSADVFQSRETDFAFRDLMNEIRSETESRCEDRNQVFAFFADPAIPEVLHGDCDSLKRILMNLLDNAVRYSKSGGRIMLTVEAGPEERDRIPLQFIVKDTGIGIADEQLPTLFEPFSGGTGKGGLGLGLAVASDLVRKLGGGIGVSSKQGSGSEFTVNITMKTARNAAGSLRSADEVRQENRSRTTGRTVTPEGSTDLSGLHVLLAEDDPLNIELLRSLLEKQGIRVDRVSGGQEAADFFRDSPEGTLDAVLIDYHMPGTDGLEAARRIRSIEKKRKSASAVPVIVLTDSAFEEDMAKSLAGIFTGSMGKPADEKKLLDTLSWALFRK